MPAPKTEFSDAAYIPNLAAGPARICDQHRHLLHTDSAYRVDHLVNQIARKFFNVRPEEDFRIRTQERSGESTGTKRSACGFRSSELPRERGTPRGAGAGG